MNSTELKNAVSNGIFNETFIRLYEKSELENQKTRYIKTIDMFSFLFPAHKNIHLFSSPGRTEIGGNHTDHQNGAVMAGAVNLDIIAAAAFHKDKVIRVKSEGYDSFEIPLDDLKVKENDSATAAIIKGIAAKYFEKGIKIDGFDMYCTSDIICGGGISSSAAFEALICMVIDWYYNELKSSPLEIARTCCFAENEYLGKKCGLLDQTSVSFGGLIFVDFKDSQNPKIERIDFNFDESKYNICITDTKTSHENLTDDYEAIRNEMKQAASFFGCEVLRDVDERQFYTSIADLRKKCSDRAILRAMHFFNETKRALLQAEALKQKDIGLFLKLVRESGESSGALLENLYSNKTPYNQEIPLAIALSKKVLGESGAVRVHGGGFAGTIQAFVPFSITKEYIKAMDKIFGEGSCRKMRIRPIGPALIY